MESGSTDNYRVKSPSLGACVKLLDLGKTWLRVFLDVKRQDFYKERKDQRTLEHLRLEGTHKEILWKRTLLQLQHWANISMCCCKSRTVSLRLVFYHIAVVILRQANGMGSAIQTPNVSLV